MDNSGGHGTDVAIKEYRDNVEEKYNIEIIFQIPRSPYTNVLDLGVWISLQAAVERQHYLKRCNVNSLVNTVNSTWDRGHLDRSISKVFLRLKNVLCCILEAGGGNDLVETKRGVKNKGIKLEEVIRRIEKNDEDLLRDDDEEEIEFQDIS